MSVLKKQSIAQYWNSNLDSRTSVWFKRTMSRNRFQCIMKFLHIADFDKMHNRNMSSNMVFNSYRSIFFKRRVSELMQASFDEKSFASHRKNLSRVIYTVMALVAFCYAPVGTGGLRRELVLCISMCVVKGD